MQLSTFLQSKPNLYLCKTLGWRFSYYYIAFLGRLYFFFKRKERKTVKNAVSTVFAGKKNAAEIRKTTRAVFRGIISHYFEKLFNAYSSTDLLRNFLSSHVQCDNIQIIEESLSEGNGALLITGHFGGVEFIPGYLGANRLPVSILAKFKTDHLRERLFEKCTAFSTRIIDPTRTPNVVKEICANLKENRIVITQCDEISEWRPSKKDKILFLGKLIWLDKTMNILTKRTQAAILFGLMHRSKDHGYEFIVTSMDEMMDQFKRRAESSLGEILLKILESFIYQYPEDWYEWKKYFSMQTVPSETEPEPPMVPVPVFNASVLKLT
ncbi:MAG: lysophospholipid acyltransferase family protein [Deltaproteobacteria bacterium]|nr:lysophospholipid acyltransferase family protein [Deltaproteobacteria bacterium]MBW2131315.1 lysophospholipid acyltransferase family protein [Deltaproteobacteria bacterium]